MYSQYSTLMARSIPHLNDNDNDDDDDDDNDDG